MDKTRLNEFSNLPKLFMLDPETMTFKDFCGAGKKPETSEAGKADKPKPSNQNGQK